VEELRRLAELHPGSATPLRTLGEHYTARRRHREAEACFAEAFARSGEAGDAFEAGRALHAEDPGAARRWFARIPEAERARFPRLAAFEAKAALDRGVGPAAARAHLDAVLRYRDTEEGRRVRGLAAVASELARAAGEADLARTLADEDHRERLARAEPRLRAARRALAKGDLAAADAALSASEAFVPGDPRGAELRARTAAAGGDRAGAEAALAELRGAAPTLARAVAAENRLRAELGLPLLPDRAAAALLAPEATREERTQDPSPARLTAPRPGG
jgi:hypothetical protein